MAYLHVKVVVTNTPVCLTLCLLIQQWCTLYLICMCVDGNQRYEVWGWWDVLCWRRVCGVHTSCSSRRASRGDFRTIPCQMHTSSVVRLKREEIKWGKWQDSQNHRNQSQQKTNRVECGIFLLKNMNHWTSASLFAWCQLVVHSCKK